MYAGGPVKTVVVQKTKRRTDQTRVKKPVAPIRGSVKSLHGQALVSAICSLAVRRCKKGLPPLAGIALPEQSMPNVQ
jgi:hypothetical protein